MWLLANKSRKGVHCFEIKAANKKFKYVLRKRRRILEKGKADAVASALISDR